MKIVDIFFFVRLFFSQENFFSPISWIFGCERVFLAAERGGSVMREWQNTLF